MSRDTIECYITVLREASVKVSSYRLLRGCYAEKPRNIVSAVMREAGLKLSARARR